MKDLLRAGVAAACLLAIPLRALHAHGGQYGFQRCPGPPPDPGRVGSVHAGPQGPGGTPAGPRAGRGIELVDDRTGWEHWWEFNKDRFLLPEHPIHQGSAPTAAGVFGPATGQRASACEVVTLATGNVLQLVLPALTKAIDSTQQRDIQSSCMIAIASAGHEPAGLDLLQLFAARLKVYDQQTREAAALAIGIAGIQRQTSIRLLQDLALDRSEGRVACARSEVDERTRTFATYGLGLLVQATPAVADKREILATLRQLVDDEQLWSRNLKVAAIHAISLLHLSAGAPADRRLLDDALACLGRFYAQDLGAAAQLWQAQVPPAIAKLLGRAHPRAAEWQQTFAAELAGQRRGKRAGSDRDRSCALALGQLCQPCDSEQSKDAAFSALLLTTFHDHQDQQTRFFAALALGQIGGTVNRRTLLAEFAKADNLQRPWLALALGVQSFEAAAKSRTLLGATATDHEVVDALRAGLDERNPSTLTGIAIGLGLCRGLDVAADLRALLRRFQNNDQCAGYLCTALALMGDQASVPDLRAVLDRAAHRPVLLPQVANALARLGDKAVADQLLQHLDDGDQSPAKLSSIASAIGLLGDRRVVEPLQRILLDDRMPDLSRAFAAVALGRLADGRPLPWQAALAQNINYRAAVETLTIRTIVGWASPGWGVLDIR